MRWTRLAVCRCITALSFALPGLGVAAGSAFAHGDPRHDLAPSEPAVLTPLTPRARVMPDRGAAGFFQPRRYYLANDDHSDYLWSGDAATYRSAFNTMLDYYMTLAESTASNPPDARGRFNADGTLWVSEYEATHTPAQFQRLIGHIRAGDLTVPINTCVQLYGAMPAEAVIRSFQYAGRLSRREGLTFPLVVPMENQTLPGGVAALWAGSGVRYSWKGICNCATTIDATDRLLEVYRFGGKDGSSVLMKWNSELYGSSYSLGGYAEALNPTAALNLMKNNSTYRARWPYDISAAFGYGWDSLQTTTPKFVQAALTLNDDTTRVIDSNEVDFFQDFEINYGLGLPTYTASYGNEWDLFSASLGEVTASVKRSFEKLRTAEALATIASFYDPAFMSARVAKRDSMTMAAGLYYEHSWGPGPGVNEATRDAWQRRIASAITAYVDTLHDNGLARLGTLVPAGALERHECSTRCRGHAPMWQIWPSPRWRRSRWWTW